jgi:hypothetical protein
MAKLQADLTDAEKVVIADAVMTRVDDYIDAARRLDLEWFLGFWANVDGFVIAGDGGLMDYATWEQQLRSDFATVREITDFEFFNRHTYVLARDAAVHSTQFRWGMVTTTGDTLRMHGSWCYVFKNFDAEWKVVHSAGTHLVE